MFITQNEIIYRLPIAKTFDISKLAQYTDVVIRKYLKPRLGLEFYTEIEADRISLGAGSPFTVYDNITAYNQGDTVIYNNIAFECIATPPAASAAISSSMVARGLSDSTTSYPSFSGTSYDR